MIDAAQQGSGYGKAALLLIADHVRSLPEGTELFLSYEEAQPGQFTSKICRCLWLIDDFSDRLRVMTGGAPSAEKFYESCGFVSSANTPFMAFAPIVFGVF